LFHALLLQLAHKLGILTLLLEMSRALRKLLIAVQVLEAQIAGPIVVVGFGVVIGGFEDGALLQLVRISLASGQFIQS